MYRTEQLKAVELENVNYDVLQEVLLRMKQNKPDLKIGEVPISFQKRIYGESKRRLIPFIIGYMKSLVRFTFIRYPLLRNIVRSIALNASLLLVFKSAHTLYQRVDISCEGFVCLILPLTVFGKLFARLERAYFSMPVKGAHKFICKLFFSHCLYLRSDS